MMKGVGLIAFIVFLQSTESVINNENTLNTDIFISELADIIRIITTDTAHVTKVLKVLKSVYNDTLGEMKDSSFSEYNSLSRDVGNECLQHTILLLKAFIRHKEWAIHMLDTFGKPPSGMYNKRLRWLGDWDQCRRTYARFSENVSLDGLTSYPFAGKYCSANFVVGMPQDIEEHPSVTVGTCFPSSCSSSESAALLQIMISVLPGNSSIADSPVVNCQEDSLPLDGQAIAVITICAVILITMVVATVYDAVFQHWLHDKFTAQKSATDDMELGEHKKSVYVIQSSPPLDNKTTTNKTPLRQDSISNGVAPRKDSDLNKPPVRQDSVSSRQYTRQSSVTSGGSNGRHNSARSVAKRAIWRQESMASKTTFRQDSVASVATVDVMIRSQLPEIVERKGDINTSTLERVLLSFSVLKNGTKLLSTRQSKGSLSVLHAVRFITMTWIVVWHVFSPLDGAESANYSDYIEDLVTRFEYTPIFNPMLAVDTFFILSGLLVSYLSLKQLEKQKGIKHFNLAMFYFHRLLRITPPYMFLLLIWVSLDKYLGDGPLWPQEEGFQREACHKSWWTNILYINNLAKGGQEKQLGCFGWSWFLACDMQFFIISPLVFIPLFYKPVIGCLACLVLVIVGAISAGLVSISHELPAMALYDQTKQEYMWEFYVKPWNRVGVYAVAMFTGYMLFRTQRKVKINRYFNLLLWLTALVLGGLTVYGLYSPSMTDPLTARESALYNATARTVWAVCVCWVIFACSCGYGGPINHVLTWPGFVPLARINYFVYLAHNILISIYNRSQRSLNTMYDYSMVYQGLGHLSMSYAAAFVLSLAFDAPVAELEKALLGRRKHKVHVPGA